MNYSTPCGFPPGPILTSLADFTEQPLEHEWMLGVRGARVLCANYELLQHDFADIPPALTGDIDQWLLENTSFISRPQVAQALANTPIPLSMRERMVHRPPRYGRAAVMLSETCSANGRRALFDVKGCGVPPDEVPVLPNSNGLLTLGEALHEYSMERLVHAALRHAGSKALPVPSYAIIDLGFDVTFHDGRPAQRATLLVRRAQTRPRFQWGGVNPGKHAARQLLELELLLRRYGITASSCGAVRFHLSKGPDSFEVRRDERRLEFGPAALERIRAATGFNGKPLVVDGVNVQISDGPLKDQSAPRIIDFGRYKLQSSFESILYTWWEADYENLVGEMVRPTDPEYVQPHPDLSLAGMQDHPLHLELKNTAELYQRGAVDGSAVAAALNAFVSPATRHLEHHAVHPSR